MANRPADGDETSLLSADPGESSSAVDVQRSDTPEESQDCSKWQVAIYAVGHFYNDLCASMWFTYLMIFLERVLAFDSTHAGFLMLLGQVTDAMSTVLIGFLSDAACLPAGLVAAIGRRKCWYIVGVFCVTFSFPFIFGTCIFCRPAAAIVTQLARTAQMTPFIMLFQFGWACVQISHLALIPELSSVESTRMKMNSFRHGFTVFANLTMFAVLYSLLNNSEAGVGSADLSAFKVADTIAIGVGTLAASTFILGLREPTINSAQVGRRRRLSLRSQTSRILSMSWNDWLAYAQFYQVGLLYMFARLFINISQIYFPFYIVVTQKRPKKFVAVLPTVAYASSLFVAGVIMPFVGGRFTAKRLFLAGSLVALTNCVWLHFPLPGLGVYGVSILLGIAQSTLLISSLSVTASLINQNTESGAFVYGAMSFLDKVSSGVVCQIVEIFSTKCAREHCSSSCADFYRNVMVFVPGFSASAIFLLLLFFNDSTLGQRRRRAASTSVSGQVTENSQVDEMAD